MSPATTRYYITRKWEARGGLSIVPASSLKVIQHYYNAILGFFLRFSSGAYFLASGDTDNWMYWADM